MAGEYFVAAELQRRGVHSSITYGNAKQTDVVVFAKESHRAIVIEVKSTGQDSWVVGGSIPEPTDDPWIFVHIPGDASKDPRFFVLTQTELHSILKPIGDDYQKKYQEKHGHKFTGSGVVSLKVKDAEPFADKWSTIIDKLVAP